MADGDVSGLWINGQSHNHATGSLRQLKLAKRCEEIVWCRDNLLTVVMTLDVMMDKEA